MLRTSPRKRKAQVWGNIEAEKRFLPVGLSAKWAHVKSTLVGPESKNQTAPRDLVFSELRK
jgi:hypothetical protein